MTGDDRSPRRPAAGDMERALDHALRDLLQTRADGEALRTVYQAIPSAPSAPDDAAAVRQREAAWSRLEARLADPDRVPYTDEVAPALALVKDERTVRPQPARSRRWSWAWSAAATLLLSVGGLLAWGSMPVEREVASGGAPQLAPLPDGSTLWLAPGSRVTYARRLGWPTGLRAGARTVQLEGEAFFDVARDGRPFRVRTSDAEVQVLGTRFAVRAATASSGTRVQVEEGRVAVTADQARVELGAGQGTVVRQTGLTVQDIPAARVAVWRRGGLAALDEPLGEVLAELSRRFDVEIDVDPAVDVQVTVSLFYPVAPRADVVLGDLCTAQGLSFERTSRGFRVTGASRTP